MAFNDVQLIEIHLDGTIVAHCVMVWADHNYIFRAVGAAMRFAERSNMVSLRVASAVGKFDGVTTDLATKPVVAFQSFSEFRITQNTING